jgi:hypothetical protein
LGNRLVHCIGKFRIIAPGNAPGGGVVVPASLELADFIEELFAGFRLPADGNGAVPAGAFVVNLCSGWNAGLRGLKERGILAAYDIPAIGVVAADAFVEGCGPVSDLRPRFH